MAGARLLSEEREEIALGIARGRSLAGAARTPRRPVSTVARAIAGNGVIGASSVRPSGTCYAPSCVPAQGASCRIRWCAGSEGQAVLAVVALAPADRKRATPRTSR